VANKRVMNAQLAASALSWWQEAGVDTLIAEEPRDWLKPKPAASPVPEPEAETAPAAALPDTIDAFRTWLSAMPLPFPTIGARREPEGDPSARLMVILDMPSPSGGWFEGEADALFDRMLSAMNGLSRDQLYLVALAPARPLSGRIDAASARRLGEIARHHIGLARPRAVLLFGEACALALLDTSVAQARGRRQEVETPAGPIPAVATIRPEQIGGRAPIRKMVWEDLQRVMEELK
jgi:uracil-DNA glycosylase